MIRLSEDYFITVDEQNYGLCRDYQRLDKKGNPVYRPLGYFGSLKELLNYWTECSVMKELSNTGEITLSDAVEIIKNGLEECRKVIESAVPDISAYPDKQKDCVRL